MSLNNPDANEVIPEQESPLVSRVTQELIKKFGQGYEYPIFNAVHGYDPSEALSRMVRHSSGIGANISFQEVDEIGERITAETRRICEQAGMERWRLRTFHNGDEATLVDPQGREFRDVWGETNEPWSERANQVRKEAVRVRISVGGGVPYQKALYNQSDFTGNYDLFIEPVPVAQS